MANSFYWWCDAPIVSIGSLAIFVDSFNLQVVKLMPSLSNGAMVNVNKNTSMFAGDAGEIVSGDGP